MPNPLTGDFDAVLQVSGGTINRLLASMHQNRGGDPREPSFPHSIALRIGDERPVGGVRGSLWLQTSVPSVELIHEASDRFWLEVGIRARYVPDPQTQALPEFINGTVRAEYKVAPVDPNCFGWREVASQCVWARLERGSVTFTGTAVDADRPDEIPRPLDDAEVNALIVRQLEALLSIEFAPNPVNVGGKLHTDSLVSLNLGSRSAVAMPVPIAGEPPLGVLSSINQVLVDGHDFVVAVSRDYVVGLFQAAYDDLSAGFAPEFRVITHIDVGPFGGDVLDIGYRVRLKNATFDWLDGIGVNAGGVTVKIWGAAETSRSEFNISFEVSQTFSLVFDAGEQEQKISVHPLGSPSVTVAASGLFGVVFDLVARSKVEAEIASKARAALSQIDVTIELKGQADDFQQVLQSFDSAAQVRFEAAEFVPDGVLLAGPIRFASRRSPQVVFVETDEHDGYSAFQSWIPGGRIDRFEWSWTWFNGSSAPGSDASSDRFVLTRAQSGSRTKFGVLHGLRDPLPGLDGGGRLCLNVSGVQVDPLSGQLVPVDAGWQCRRFGFAIPLHPVDGARRLFLREYADSPLRSPGPPREVGLVEVGQLGGRASGANTLVVHIDSGWEDDLPSVLEEGLSACRRENAGLLVLLLFAEGLLERLGSGARERLEALVERLEAPLLVNEDVHGAWSATLDLGSERGEPAWRLISPTGGISWKQDGHVAAEELGAALDASLFPGAAASAEYEQHGLDIGEYVSPGALDPSFGGLGEFACPPAPVGKGIGSLFVAFVQRDSAASRAEVERLRRKQHAAGKDAPFLAVVLDDESAESKPSEAGRGVERTGTIVDSTGAVASRFGIRHWPTIVRIDEDGYVTEVAVGEPGEEAQERG
jgi:hypothetical protein